MGATVKHIFAGFVGLLMATGAASGGYYNDKDELAQVQEIDVVVDDSVKDGCLRVPNILKVEAELILRRSGIAVVDEPSLSNHTIRIEALGNHLGSDERYEFTCLVAMTYYLYKFKLQMEGHSELVVAFMRGSLHWGDKSGMQGQLREEVSEVVTELANEILKARQAQSTEDPEADAEYDALMDDLLGPRED
jgi:hypothetical protein